MKDLFGHVEVQGSANSSATVTVNNQSTYRKGDYYRAELSVANSSAAIWQGITNRIVSWAIISIWWSRRPRPISSRA